MKKRTSSDMVTHSGISVKEVIECHLKGKKAPRLVHDEGYYEYKIEEKKSIGFIVCWIYDGINNNYYGKIICEITDYKETKSKILKEMYGDY